MSTRASTNLTGIVDAGGLVTSLALITNFFCGPSVPSLTVTPWIIGCARTPAGNGM